MRTPGGSCPPSTNEIVNWSVLSLVRLSSPTASLREYFQVSVPPTGKSHPSKSMRHSVSRGRTASCPAVALRQSFTHDQVLPVSLRNVPLNSTFNEAGVPDTWSAVVRAQWNEPPLGTVVVIGAAPSDVAAAHNNNRIAF